jgi:hypothetical protein
VVKTGREDTATVPLRGVGDLDVSDGCERRILGGYPLGAEPLMSCWPTHGKDRQESPHISNSPQEFE